MAFNQTYRSMISLEARCVLTSTESHLLVVGLMFAHLRSVFCVIQRQPSPSSNCHSAQMIFRRVDRNAYAMDPRSYAVPGSVQQRVLLIPRANEASLNSIEWVKSSVHMVKCPVEVLLDRNHTSASIHAGRWTHVSGSHPFSFKSLNPPAGGGCVLPLHGIKPSGRDCSAIPGVRNVQCQRSKCVVRSCMSGWHVTEDAGACMPSTNCQ